jgi:hypothetical protein
MGGEKRLGISNCISNQNETSKMFYFPTTSELTNEVPQSAVYRFNNKLDCVETVIYMAIKIISECLDQILAANTIESLV